MDAESLKIILDLQKKVTLYERATNDLYLFLKSNRTDVRSWDLNNHAFEDLMYEIIKLKQKAGLLPKSDEQGNEGNQQG
jgi:hypothetical protein